MKFPQTPEDLKTEILISSDKAGDLGDLRLRQLIKILEDIDHEIIVEGVIQVFEMRNRSNAFQDQEFAGKILQLINPKSKKELREFLSRTLNYWDKSVEQLPFWFRDNYGIDVVKNAFEKFQCSDSENDKLKTMKFWLQLR